MVYVVCMYITTQTHTHTHTHRETHANLLGMEFGRRTVLDIAVHLSARVCRWVSWRVSECMGMQGHLSERVCIGE